MDPEYKLLHEEFVSNSTGTTVEEIKAISCVTPLSVLLLAITAKLSSSRIEKDSFKWSIVELLCISVLLLLCLTVFADRLICVFLSIVLVLISTLIALSFNKPKPRLTSGNFPLNKKLTFITNYRSGMLLVTAICILGVDFPIFPRRFAKTERFGYGLMDLGVGSFMFAAGLVSEEARSGIVNRLKFLSKSLHSSIPIVILGFLRLASVKLTGYHEHVSEYGLHWNFFFTMASVKVLSSVLVSTVLPLGFCWTAAILISITYEGFLVSGLADWVFQEDLITRDNQDIFTANREGLVSSVGYLALYLAGIGWGKHLFKNATTYKSRMMQCPNLVIWSLLMWVSLIYSEKRLFHPSSRRLANWCFFNWMISYNLFVLAMFTACDVLYDKLAHTLCKDDEAKKGPHKPKVKKASQNKELEIHGWCPYIFEAISYNALPYFLIANLVTGAVNFSFDTVRSSDLKSVFILLGYISIIHFVIVYLYKRKLKIKLS